MTERQIEMLWRLVETPILCFDGDAAGQRAAMRAVTRALPLLRPAHSLRIVRLPAGLDPDDLLKREGVGAMERLLSGAQGLLDTLWEHERDVAPLSTPEDKAGLKARLMAHVETIADPDIKALYRRELTDRFSAFAFPRREFAPREPGRRTGRMQESATPPRPSPETARRLKHAAGGGARDALAAAAVAGLLRWPGEIARHAESLAHLADADPRFDVLLDASLSGAALESEGLSTILGQRGLRAPSAAEYGDLRFGFLADEADAAQAAVELGQAIGLLVERPALDAALAEATGRFERELSDEAYAEQQRLLKRKLEFDTRLRQMASGRSAHPKGESPNNMAE